MIKFVIIFKSFEDYNKWYHSTKGKVHSLRKLSLKSILSAKKIKLEVEWNV